MNAAFGWPGGKRSLLPTLLRLLPAHDLYVEVFAGSAKLLFAKPPAPREVLNDRNGDVANFFRVAKHRAAELAERMELECIHAARFVELLACEPLDEVGRALRFLYLTWYSFGSKGEHFAGACSKPPRSLATVRETLARTADRLARVVIEQRDFADVLTRYDAPGTCFYLDPPYVAFQDNGRYTALTPERREELFAAVAGLRGQCLLSFDDHAEVRALCRRHGLRSRKVDVRYTLGGVNHSKTAGELLISNYDLSP